MAHPYWLDPAECNIEDFAALVERKTVPAHYPFAARIDSNVPVYDCSDVRRHVAESPAMRRAVLAEWGTAMMDGPGLVVLAGAYTDMPTLDAASDVFRAIIDDQHAHNSGGGDHFAKPGANDRIWNALEKLCLRAPEVFATYYANDIVALVSEAWLGPDYQMTSQINVVNTGGEAQQPHRDYHLGFQTPEIAQGFPTHVHRLSPVLTLQGAVAHTDMPLETGPTLYLPYSQTYEPGYLAWPQPAFRDYFIAHRVQLPLKKGDAVLFNPAMFHAAGSNRTRDVKRMANLLQVSSAYGRAMESVDRSRMSVALYPALRSMLKDRRLSDADCANAVASCAEGYAFPTNLDRDPPIGGLAPASQQDLMLQALREDWPPARFAEAIAAQAEKRLT